MSVAKNHKHDLPQSSNLREAISAPAPSLIDERNKLAEENMHLVRPIARSVLPKVPRSIDFDDLLSAGTLGLLDAAEKYDPGRNVPFPCYARPRIRWEILSSFRRKAYKEATHETLERPDELPGTGAEDEIYRNITHRESRDWFTSMFNRSDLNARQQYILHRMYVHCESQATIGIKLKVCSSRVSQVHREALRVLATSISSFAPAEMLNNATFRAPSLTARSPVVNQLRADQGHI